MDDLICCQIFVFDVVLASDPTNVQVVDQVLLGSGGNVCHQLVVHNLRALHAMSLFWSFRRSVPVSWWLGAWADDMASEMLLESPQSAQCRINEFGQHIRHHHRHHEWVSSGTQVVMNVDAFSVVSIPIIILGRTQLRTSQKVSLGALLCLSVVMIAIACARFSGLRNIATVWIYLWHYIDACVACIMASLLTFRTLFVSGRTRVFKQQELKGQLPSIKQQELKGRLPSIKQRVLHNMKILNMAAWEMVEDEMEELPEVPSATPSGLRNFISRYHRSPGSTTAMNSEGDRTKYDC